MSKWKCVVIGGCFCKEFEADTAKEAARLCLEGYEGRLNVGGLVKIRVTELVPFTEFSFRVSAVEVGGE